MQAHLVFVLFTLVLCVSAVYDNGAERIEVSESLFQEFIVRHNKVYKSKDEYNLRLNNFMRTVDRVNARNQASTGAVYGITKFSDMSTDEFSTRVLMKNKQTVDTDTLLKRSFGVRALANDNPTTLDWRQKGAVTAVKDQGQCGSCWAFSTVESVESAWIIAGRGDNESTILSPQQLVDCDQSSRGCGGGFTTTAYDYLVKSGGLAAESKYPYTASNGQCYYNSTLAVAKITGYKKATIWFNEKQLEDNLVAMGPVSVCVHAVAWQDYVSGVMTASQCGFFNTLDHCVQLVGYDKTQSSPFWIVRNSWTTQWGIEGYIWLEMGKDTCGIAHQANWPTV